MSPSAKTLRWRVAQHAGNRCGYCLTHEVVSGIPLTLEHIIPKALGGTDVEDNLWLSCRLCNETKGIQIGGVDRASGDVATLFNPRTQVWQDHFRWGEDGVRIIGRTPTGRATIDALNLNSELRLRSRAIWMAAGWHPPE